MSILRELSRMGKWIKVYRGPGYPVDPWKQLRRDLDVIMELVAENAQFKPDFALHSGVMWNPAVRATTTPLFTPEVEEARRAVRSQPHDRQTLINTPMRRQTPEMLNALLCATECLGPPTVEQTMDATQARARLWISKFIEQPELSLEKKKERREAEQYMETEITQPTEDYP